MSDNSRGSPPKSGISEVGGSVSMVKITAFGVSETEGLFEGCGFLGRSSADWAGVDVGLEIGVSVKGGFPFRTDVVVSLKLYCALRVSCVWPG